MVRVVQDGVPPFVEALHTLHALPAKRGVSEPTVAHPATQPQPTPPGPTVISVTRIRIFWKADTTSRASARGSLPRKLTGPIP